MSAMCSIGERIAAEIRVYKAEANITSDLFVDEIPPKKLANARRTCEVPEGERVHVLLDCTVFGSAKDSMLFGEEAVFYHSNYGTGRVPWAELAGLAFTVGSMNLIELGPAHHLCAAGCQLSAQQIVAMLRRAQQAIGAAGGDSEQAKTAGPPADHASTVVSWLESYRKQGDSIGEMHVGDLPVEITGPAREACCVPPAERLLSLLRRSSEDCFLFTNDALYVNDSQRARISYAELAGRPLQSTDAPASRQVELWNAMNASSGPRAFIPMVLALQRALRGMSDPIVYHRAGVHAFAGEGVSHVAIVVTADEVIMFDGGPIDMSLLTAAKQVKFDDRIREVAKLQNLDDLKALPYPRYSWPRAHVRAALGEDGNDVHLTLVDGSGIRLKLFGREAEESLLAVLAASVRYSCKTP
jgi:hypothetical protein